ncbi:MAG: hypothetical protein AAF921_00910 [Cyanobacteria bacterium P01_D01_bin.44]
MISAPSPTIGFQTLTNKRLESTVTGLTTNHEQIILTIQLSSQNWQRVLKEGIFHLDDEAEPPGFEPDRPVSLTLRLRPAIARLTSDHSEAIATMLTDPTSPLNHTEAWLATEIVQDVDLPPDSDDDDDAFLQMGARTRWAEPWTPQASSTGAVLKTLETFLNDEEWPFTNPEENVLRFPAGVDEVRSWMVAALANEEVGTCTLLSIPTGQVLSAKRADAAIWMVKMNYDLPQGCFEMDTDDGEVRYRSTFPALHRSQLEVGISAHLSIMAKHFDTLVTFVD